MATIHPTSIIEGDVELADDVVVGPYCTLQGTIKIGAGTNIMANCHVFGLTCMGESNVLWPGAVLGGPPQDINFDHAQEAPGLMIGDRNIFREGATLHRGKTEEPTRIGNDNYFMTNSHVGHDTVMGNNIQVATGAMLGGHCIVDDRVIIGGATTVHQFCRIGEGAMLAGSTGASLDVPPWFLMTTLSTCSSLNLIGMRRSGMSAEAMASRKWVFRTLYRERRSVKGALEVLRGRMDDPVIAEYVEFIESSDRGICWGPKRNHARG